MSLRYFTSYLKAISIFLACGPIVLSGENEAEHYFKQLLLEVRGELYNESRCHLYDKSYFSENRYEISYIELLLLLLEQGKIDLTEGTTDYIASLQKDRWAKAKALLLKKEAGNAEKLFAVGRICLALEEADAQQKQQKERKDWGISSPVSNVAPHFLDYPLPGTEHKLGILGENHHQFNKAGVEELGNRLKGKEETSKGKVHVEISHEIIPYIKEGKLKKQENAFYMILNHHKNPNFTTCEYRVDERWLMDTIITKEGKMLYMWEALYFQDNLKYALRLPGSSILTLHKRAEEILAKVLEEKQRRAPFSDSKLQDFYQEVMQILTERAQKQIKLLKLFDLYLTKEPKSTLGEVLPNTTAFLHMEKKIWNRLFELNVFHSLLQNIEELPQNLETGREHHYMLHSAMMDVMMPSDEGFIQMKQGGWNPNTTIVEKRYDCQRIQGLLKKNRVHFSLKASRRGRVAVRKILSSEAWNNESEAMIIELENKKEMIIPYKEISNIEIKDWEDALYAESEPEPEKVPKGSYNGSLSLVLTPLVAVGLAKSAKNSQKTKGEQSTDQEESEKGNSSASSFNRSF